jgi:DNA-binding response OmpR family regulator
MPDDERLSPVSPWRAALSASPLHAPPRVLVAEDDPEMRRLVVEALRGDGYEVLEARDGGRLLVALAREFAGQAQPDLVDLVVTDVRMPICSGLQIVEQLRAARWPTPVILMTAFGDTVTRERARAFGAVLFDKPFDIDDLRTAVNCLLRRAKD